MQALRLSSSVEASRNPFFVSRLEKLAGKQLWLSRHWAPQALDRIAKSGSQRSGTPGVSVADTTTGGNDTADCSDGGGVTMQEQSLAEKRAAAKGARYDPDTTPPHLPTPARQPPRASSN